MAFRVIYVSFGGLQLMLKGVPSRMGKFKVDQRLFSCGRSKSEIPTRNYISLELHLWLIFFKQSEFCLACNNIFWNVLSFWLSLWCKNLLIRVIRQCYYIPRNLLTVLVFSCILELEFFNRIYIELQALSLNSEYCPWKKQKYS